MLLYKLFDHRLCSVAGYMSIVASISVTRRHPDKCSAFFVCNFISTFASIMQKTPSIWRYLNAFRAASLCHWFQCNVVWKMWENQKRVSKVKPVYKRIRSCSWEQWESCQSNKFPSAADMPWAHINLYIYSSQSYTLTSWPWPSKNSKRGNWGRWQVVYCRSTYKRLLQLRVQNCSDRLSHDYMFVTPLF